MRTIAGAVLGSSCMGCAVPGTLLCDACASFVRPSPDGPPIVSIDRATIPWRYEGVPRRLVLALKLSAVRAAADPLALGMAAAFMRGPSTGEAITWVPARARDIRRRGFDHAEALARLLGSALGLPVVRALARSGDQPDQAGLGRAARAVNLQRAFRGLACDHDAVVLVDDLVTTGATATACAEALRAAGCSKVELAAACRV